MVNNGTKALPIPEGGMVEAVLARSRAQNVLFAKAPSRLDVQAIELPVGSPLRRGANVWRNQNFETLEGLLRPFLTYGSLDIQFHISGYDDTLGFAEWVEADVEILWLDSSRYVDRMSFEEWLSWLRGRLVDLRARSSAPILFASWDAWSVENGAARLAELAGTVAGACFADLQAASLEEDVALLDLRVTQVSGSPISRTAQVVLARRLGCHWLPGLLLPPIKAVAVDLDNTLHAGVLGEDHVDGVRLKAGHVALQEALRALRARGVFLALISRNLREDVDALFERRTDYPLRLADFSVVEVSWGSKADALRRVAQQLRIALDAVLFVDDNPGELASVAASCHGIHAVFASPDGAGTLRALSHFPGLWRWSKSTDDVRRVDDMKANAERTVLLNAAEGTEHYFRELDVTLTLRHDAVADIPRLVDLCRKTNQFNLGLRRFNNADLAAFMAAEDACVAAVALSDRLSESGTVAAVVAVRKGDTLSVEEVCVSCRALGRRLEDMIVLLALREMGIFEGCRWVSFVRAVGPRNQPATEWLDGLAGRLASEAVGEAAIPAERVRAFAVAPGLQLIQE